MRMLAFANFIIKLITTTIIQFVVNTRGPYTLFRVWEAVRSPQPQPCADCAEYH